MCKLQMNQEARKLYHEAWKTNEKMLAPGGLLEEIKDWGGKRMGNILRIAGALHAAKFPDTFNKHEIDEVTFKNALAIGDYLIPHAKVAYGLASESQGLQSAKCILAWLKTLDRKEFTFNDCHSRFKSSLPTAPDVEKPLKLLEERNYIREISQPTRRPGRPSRIFQINPEFL